MTCIVYGCGNPNSHSTPEHTCGNCQKKGHGRVECGNSQSIEYLKNNKDDKNSKKYDAYDRIKFFGEEKLNSIKTVLQNRHYKSVYSGLGSSIYIRRVYKDRFEYLFMHQDDWGQYGNTQRFDLYKEFIKNYIEVKNT